MSVRARQLRDLIRDHLIQLLMSRLSQHVYIGSGQMISKRDVVYTKSIRPVVGNLLVRIRLLMRLQICSLADIDSVIGRFPLVLFVFSSLS